MSDPEPTTIPPVAASAPVERPTVGRRLWYWAAAFDAAPLNVADPRQPFDAGVVFVHPVGDDGHQRVNLSVTDHFGEQKPVHNVVLLNPFDSDHHGSRDEGYATWMPYQVKKGTGSS